ncbi:MAG: hypothetical protein M3350_08875 [Actinomycetota bacterium]|nr:hypothetical protein [Actinomycetota bacterium]
MSMRPEFVAALLSAIDSVQDAWVLVTVTSELVVPGAAWLSVIAPGAATDKESSVPTVPVTGDVDVAACEAAGAASAAVSAASIAT